MRLTNDSLRGLNNSRNSMPALDDKAIAERSINYMQQRQSTASVGSRAARKSQVAVNSAALNTTGDRIFGTPS